MLNFHLPQGIRSVLIICSWIVFLFVDHGLVALLGSSHCKCCWFDWVLECLELNFILNFYLSKVIYVIVLMLVRVCSLFYWNFLVLVLSVWLSFRMLRNDCYVEFSSITGHGKNNYAVLWLCFCFVEHLYCSSLMFSLSLFLVWLSYIMLFEP